LEVPCDTQSVMVGTGQLAGQERFARRFRMRGVDAREHGGGWMSILEVTPVELGGITTTGGVVERPTRSLSRATSPPRARAC